MVSVDLRRLGQVLLTRPGPSLRAFGTAPYLRVVPVPRLSTRAIQVRLGSFYVWAITEARRPLFPLAVYFEIQTLPAITVRVAWLRGLGLALRHELFSDHPQH